MRARVRTHSRKGSASPPPPNWDSFVLMECRLPGLGELSNDFAGKREG